MGEKLMKIPLEEINKYYINIIIIERDFGNAEEISTYSYCS
jgi:hypothetical protein